MHCRVKSKYTSACTRLCAFFFLNRTDDASVLSFRLIIILQVTVISSESHEKIGNPVNTEAAADSFAVTSPGSAGATTPAVQPQQQQAQPPRAQPQQYQEAARQPAAGGSRVQAGGSPRAICPIESLSPYQTKWEVRARVLFKSELRHWSNNKGTGKVFNVTLGDETGEINATGFNAAADAFYDKLQKDKVYYVSKGRINIAKNKKFSNVANEYEIVLDERNTIIEEVCSPSWLIFYGWTDCISSAWIQPKCLLSDTT
jgi:replication factor A1